MDVPSFYDVAFEHFFTREFPEGGSLGSQRRSEPEYTESTLFALQNILSDISSNSAFESLVLSREILTVEKNMIR